MPKLGQQIGLLMVLFDSSLSFFHPLPAVPHVSQNAKISSAKILSELLSEWRTPDTHGNVCV